MIEKENIKKMLVILTDAIKNNKYDEDILKINNLYDMLLNLNPKIINIEELNNIKKDIIDLEVKYDEFNELSYYFNPVYIYQ